MTATDAAAASPFLADEHLEVRRMVRDFALEEVAPHATALDEEKRFPSEVVPKLAELGLLGVPWPEEVGGAGMDYLAYAIVIEELSRVCGTTGITVAAHLMNSPEAPRSLRHRTRFASRRSRTPERRCSKVPNSIKL